MADDGHPVDTETIAQRDKGAGRGVNGLRHGKRPRTAMSGKVDRDDRTVT
jgi:hypothetical protein